MADFLSTNKERNRINIEALKRVIAEMPREDLEKFLLSEYLTCGVYCAYMGPVNFAALVAYGFEPEWLMEICEAGDVAVNKAIELAEQIVGGN